MNQVSWSRILQRVESEEPEEAGAAVINLRDHAPQWRQNRHGTRRHAPGGADLEGELQRALNRASQRGRERGFATMPSPHETIFPEENQPVHRREQPARHRTALRDAGPQALAVRAFAPPPAKTSGSGAKNLLAISLSIAVIGFAFHQINNQWLEANGVQTPAQQTPESRDSAAPALVTGSTSGIDSAETGGNHKRAAAFSGNRLDLRPSLANETGAPLPEQGARKPSARSEDIKQAAIDPYGSANDGATPLPAAPSASSAATSSEGTEQLMLRRGREMIERGHISGARLIFEHLAGQKSALGAFALAQTYDPNFLATQTIDDATPDEQLAAKWYQFAAELTEAAARR